MADKIPKSDLKELAEEWVEHADDVSHPPASALWYQLGEELKEFVENYD